MDALQIGRKRVDGSHIVAARAGWRGRTRICQQPEHQHLSHGGPIVRGVEVNEAPDAFRMVDSEAGHLVAGHRVDDEMDARQREPIDKAQDVSRERGGVVARSWSIRFAVPATGHSNHAEMAGEPWSKFVEYVRGVAKTREEQDDVALSTPIQVVQANAVVVNESRPVRRQVTVVRYARGLRVRRNV